MKRIASVVLALILLIALSVNAGAQSASFPDITDADLARDVAVLQMLGAVGGDDYGNFTPDRTLTRAAFCKMAIIIMGRGDAEPAYRNRTIFPDVRADHWARGYINLAVTGEKRLIQGGSDGLFNPDTDITAAQAVTILVRMLGYTDSDAGMLWPQGYLSLASDVGLTDGLNLPSPNGSMTRAQAARLFCNLLSTPVKGGSSFIGTLGTAVQDVVIMQLGVTAADGTSGAVRTSSGTLKTVNDILPPSILGLRGTILKNSMGKLLTFLPEKTNQVTVTAAEVSAGWLKDASGIKYEITPETTAYTSTEITTYGAAFIEIAAGMRITLFYNNDGKVDGLYISTLQADSAVIAGTQTPTAAISALTGGDTGYTIVKNGAAAALTDILPNDVLTYDASARILYVSDFRLTGCYENCWPNMEYPVNITLMGHEFPVLPSAVQSLSSYKIGQTITLLFTHDLQVAGAATGITGATAVGIVQSGITATSGSVKLLNGLVLSGNPNLTAEAASKLSGELVTVYSTAPGRLGLSRLSSSGAAGSLDLSKKTLGTAVLSTSVQVFERVGTSPVAQISLADLTQDVIGMSKILYAGYDAAGHVSTLILDDVTGDRYTYGFLKEDTVTESGGSFSITNRTVSVLNSANKAGTTPIVTGLAFIDGAPGGIAVSADGQKATGIVTLTEVKNVKRSDFYTVNGVTYITVNSMEFPVASNVECYNSLSKTWFDSLADARAFSDNLTVCYDRPAADGGKIRVVIAN